MRILRRLLLVVAILGLGLFGAAWWLLRGSLPQLDGEITAPLKAAVTVERDALGSATIAAANRSDLAWSLGYVHAQERYFQMDLLRRAAAGELSALLGGALLDVDRARRPHRFRVRAGEALAAMAPEQRQLIDTYRDGVNAGLAALSVRPWEYLLLRETPAPWRSEDTALVIYAMFFDLNSDGANERELHLAQMKSSLPEAVFRFLVQPGSEWDAPLRGEPFAATQPPDASVLDFSNIADGKNNAAPTLATLAPEDLGHKPGSNNFAVGGALTTTGAALVADDMHLTLRVPNIWYRANLKYPDPADASRTIELHGVSLPGTPAVLAGSNGHIAWGYTNSYGDWTDWVRVQRDPANPSRYRVPEGWDTIAVDEEVIAIKGSGSETVRVENTRWGPILAKDTDGTPLALAWTAHQPRVLNLELLELERTRDAASALALAPRMGMPVQNFVVGDRDGHIGWTLTGNGIPRRKGFDPQLPADWSQPGTGWVGWLEPTEFPQILDPPEHRLWTANARTIDSDWLAIVGDGGYDLGARSRQIRDGLRAQNSFTPADLLAIQLDNRALFLERWRELLQKSLETSTHPKAAALKAQLARWDGEAGKTSSAYGLVRQFRKNVIATTLAPFQLMVTRHHPGFEMPSAQGYEAAVWKLLEERPRHLLDPRHADWDALLQASVTQLAEAQAQPRNDPSKPWGDNNRAAIRHPLSSALPGFLARHLDMPMQPLSGDHNMPHVQTPSFGASERFAISPGHEKDAYLMMPGGQSSHPLSPFHGAGHSDWVEGRPTPLLPGPTHYRLMLTPST
ncbi:penicillin acylase family protein [Tahibacter amnicola]|uniref:Penicillin acylase family protein n=1 Tax=Tahibacter amnicola TaxID=2976241 RepID=A0ABY6B9P0_9GAMM|nr:penicillin acylase family protein [Tahibacter amnicola]UXI66783.1 penicillin acylase family protein [Tahibacter amnicola]